VVPLFTPLMFPLELIGSPLTATSAVGGFGTQVTQPSDERVPARIKTAGSVEGGLFGVIGDPGNVSAGCQEVLSHAAVAGRTSVREGFVDVTGCRRGLRAKNSCTQDIIPKAGACQTLSTRAPRSPRRPATCQHPYPPALSNGVPPPIEPPIASMLAPPAMSA